MRILFLNPCGQMGGAETSLRELLANLRSTEPDWKLYLLLGEDGPFVDIARRLGVKVTVLPFPPAVARLGDAGGTPIAQMKSLVRATIGIALYARKLRAAYREIVPDLIHTNGFKMHILGSWTKRRKTPLVWHIHDYVSSRPITRRFLGMCRGGCTAVIANSNSVADDVRANLQGVIVTTVYNAIDFERFTPSGGTLDFDKLSELPSAPPETVRVGLVGTFARWKGHKIFLQALSQLPPDLPVRGYIVGGPIYQTSGSQWSPEELRQEAATLGIAGKVGFTGFVEDVPSVMRSLDIVVHASTQPEPFGMVIVEAMACAKPVIVSNMGGAAELFEEGRTALGHPAGDAAALARQIEALARDPGLRIALGRSARETAARRFYGRRMASEAATVYRNCQRRRGVSSLEPSFNS